MSLQQNSMIVSTFSSVVSVVVVGRRRRPAGLWTKSEAARGEMAGEKWRETNGGKKSGAKWREETVRTRNSYHNS
jgi:hypothetical protein